MILFFKINGRIQGKKKGKSEIRMQNDLALLGRMKMNREMIMTI